MEIRRSIALCLIGAETLSSPGRSPRLAVVDGGWRSKIGELSTNPGTGKVTTKVAQSVTTGAPTGHPLHLSGSGC